MPVALDALLARLPGRHREFVRARANSGGVLTEKSAAALIAALNNLSRVAADEVSRLMNQDARAAHRLTGDGLQAAVQEGDAVRLALDIADLPRRAMRDVRPDGEMSFLEQLEAVRASEDTTIAYDGMRFLDFDRIDSPSGVVAFANGYERLAIVNVNRQPLERTTGADLIYINETHPASFSCSTRRCDARAASRLSSSTGPTPSSRRSSSGCASSRRAPTTGRRRASG
jgi:hypothetical protein